LKEKLWVRRPVHGWVVSSGPEERPRTAKDAYYRLNGKPVYRADGHPDGPSSVPWLVIRGNRAYSGEGSPGGPGGGAKYLVEPVRQRGRGVTVRPVTAADYLDGDQL